MPFHIYNNSIIEKGEETMTRYFEYQGCRYDVRTVVKMQSEDGEVKETVFLGYGKFEDINPYDLSGNYPEGWYLKEIVHPIYYIDPQN